jgi:hypothetical protein
MEPFEFVEADAGARRATLRRRHHPDESRKHFEKDRALDLSVSSSTFLRMSRIRDLAPTKRRSTLVNERPTSPRGRLSSAFSTQ